MAKERSELRRFARGGSRGQGQGHWRAAQELTEGFEWSVKKHIVTHAARFPKANRTWTPAGGAPPS